jgi:hypothetical protein
MISTCPHCGRPVANDEWLTRTRLGWVPTLCANGDGPVARSNPVTDRFGHEQAETVRNHLYWYVSARNDAGKFWMLLGPYESYEEATSNVLRGNHIVHEVDRDAPWYGYGVCSSNKLCEVSFGR